MFHDTSEHEAAPSAVAPLAGMMMNCGGSFGGRGSCTHHVMRGVCDAGCGTFELKFVTRTMPGLGGMEECVQARATVTIAPVAASSSALRA
jgi:hypothetical protein